MTLRRRDKPRRPLEDGTLITDFLGKRNLLRRTQTLERRTEGLATSMLTVAAAGNAYTRLRGALFMTGWGQPNVPLNQSEVVLNRFGSPGLAPLILPFDAAVTSLMVVSTLARADGTLTVGVFIDGVDTGMAATLDDVNTTTVEETAALGEIVFAAGEKVTLRITTSGWGPNSADMMAMIEVAAA